MAGHALYRFYGDAGTLLYVGITDNPHRRFGQHAKGKEWWPQVRGISIDWYEARAAVEAAERRAIRVEQPVHNLTLRRRLVPVPLSSAQAKFSDDELKLIESVECAWTAFWFSDPNAIDRTGSRFRHDGRIYAPQPNDWQASVAKMCRQGVTESEVFRCVRIVRNLYNDDPRVSAEFMWTLFVELTARPTA